MLPDPTIPCGDHGAPSGALEDGCLSSFGYGKLRQRQGRIQSAERAMPTYLTL
jgi:hypothetical protein